MNVTAAKTMLSCRLWKEFLVLRNFVLAFLLMGPISAYALQDRDEGVRTIIFVVWALVCAIIGSTAFGHEFSHHTFDSLLAQPVPRLQIWREKHQVMGWVLGFIAVWLWGWNRNLGVQGFYFIGTALVTFLTAPTLTLISRNALGGPIFTLAIPFSLMLMTVEIVARLYPEATVGAAIQDRMTARVVSVLGIVYVAVVHLLGRRFFQRMEVVGNPKVLALPGLAWLKGRGAEAAYVPAKPAGMIWSLIVKEFRLQQFNFLLAGIFMATVALVVVLKWLRPAMEEYLILLPFFIYMALIAMIPGSTAVAEERQLGTLQAQLIMPLSRAKQWLIKVGTVLVVTYGLGMILPLLTYQAIDGWLHLSGGETRSDDGVILVLSWIYAGGTAISLYASSWSGNGLRAIMSTTAMGTVGAMLATAVIHFTVEQETPWKEQLTMWARSAYHDPESGISWLRTRLMWYFPDWGTTLWCVGIILVSLAVAGLLSLLLAFGFQNYRRISVSPKSLKLQLVTLAIYLMVSVHVLGDLAVVLDVVMVEDTSKRAFEVRRQMMIPQEFR